MNVIHRLLLHTAVILSLVVPTAVRGVPTALAQSQCEFVLGFKMLRDRTGAEVVGECLENQWGYVAGATQRTTKGVLTWRKDDGSVTFATDTHLWRMAAEGTLQVQPRTGVPPTQSAAAPPVPTEASAERSGATVIFVPGLESSMVRGQLGGALGDGFADIKAALEEASFQSDDFLTFGYRGHRLLPDGRTIQPLDFLCREVSAVPEGKIRLLYNLVRAVERAQPGEPIAIVGHSYGGLLAVSMLDHLIDSGGGTNVRLIATLHSPLTGVSPARRELALLFGQCAGDPALTWLRELHLAGEATRQVNQWRVAEAAALGITVATVGNVDDCFYRPLACESLGAAVGAGLGVAAGSFLACSTVVGCLVPLIAGYSLIRGAGDQTWTQFIDHAHYVGLWELGTGDGVRDSHRMALQQSEAVQAVAWIIQAVLRAQPAPRTAAVRRNAPDAITNVSVAEMSERDISIAVHYRHGSDRGTNVYLGAAILRRGRQTDWFGYRPAPLRRGSGTATISVSYGHNNPPPLLPTDQIQVFMYVGGEFRFYSETFQYAKTWRR